MPRQNINIGVVANDGNGDTLRTGGRKINENFVELYRSIGGDSDSVSSRVSFTETGVSFEGSVNDGFETLLGVKNPTGDRTVLIPDHTGSIVLDSDAGTLTNKTLETPLLTSPLIQDSEGAEYAYTILGANDVPTDVNARLPALSADDEFTFNDAVQTVSNKTLSVPILNSPIVGGKSGGGYIGDSSGNNLIEFDGVGNAVNHVRVSNNSTGNGVKVEAAGNDANVPLDLSGKGTGGVAVKSRLVLETSDTSTSTAVDLDKPLTVFSPGSGTIEPTLGDGEAGGEIHYFISRGTGNVNLTGNDNIEDADSAGSFFVMDPGSSLTLAWHGGKWQVLSSLQGYDGENTNPIRLV